MFNPSCKSNEQGYVVAPEGGDRRYGPSPRENYLERISQQCDMQRGLRDDQGSLVRTPYLQQPVGTSMSLVWTSSEAGLTVLLRPATSSQASRVVGRKDNSTRSLQAPLVQYVANLGALQADETYCYQIVSPSGQRLYRGGFHTSASSTVRFSVLGDLGKNSEDQHAVLAQLKTVRSDFLLVTGDLAYDAGTLGQYEKYFFTIYRDLLSVLPIFPASGNHDYQTQRAAAFREVFVLPENSGSAGRERWYSFEWGPVHVAVLDTELLLDEQARWLQEDLTSHDREWEIIVLHRPPYSSGAHGSDMEVRDSLVPVFREQAVDLVLSGHEHNYERSLPIDGVTYVVTGGGGRGTRSVGNSAFTAFAARVAHFVYITADRKTLSLHAIDASGVEFDTFQSSK